MNKILYRTSDMTKIDWICVEMERHYSIDEKSKNIAVNQRKV